MEKKSVLYQLIGVRMNGVMNSITNSDREYQEIIRKSDKYSGKLEELELPEEIRLLIDRYVSKQNALDSRYKMLAYLLVFLTARRCFCRNACLRNRNRCHKK